MNYLYILLSCSLFIGCSSKRAQEKDLITESDKVNRAEELFQGVWFLHNTESPFLRVVGDSLRFYEHPEALMAFDIIKDTLYTYGNGTYKYKIDRQSEYSFGFRSLSNHAVKLYKSVDLADSIYFEPIDLGTSKETIQSNKDSSKQKNDSVIFHNSNRYHGYAFVNPSSFKVYKPMYSDEGVRIDQIYYDNIIYICVYQGTDKLFGKNIYKREFKSILEDSFYSSVILSSMHFVGVDDSFFSFRAKVEVPNSLMYDLIDVLIDRETHELTCRLTSK